MLSQKIPKTKALKTFKSNNLIVIVFLLGFITLNPISHYITLNIQQIAVRGDVSTNYFDYTKLTP